MSPAGSRPNRRTPGGRAPNPRAAEDADGPRAPRAGAHAGAARAASRERARDVARLSEGEWKVMRVLWRRQPLSAREVLDELAAETGWAYTTVKTVLSRLAEKGAVRETRGERAGLYAPLVTRTQARRAALRSLLDRAFEGGLAPMLGFLLQEERLTSKERETLQAMLDERDGRTASKGSDGRDRGAGRDERPGRRKRAP